MFLKYEKQILEMNYEFVNAADPKQLQKFWAELAIESGKLVVDKNLFSWPTLSSLISTLSETQMIANNLLLRRLRELKENAIAPLSNKSYGEIDGFFNSENTPTIPIKSISTFNTDFKKEISETPREDVQTKQDLMRYGIMDFVLNTETNATKELLNDIYDPWKQSLKKKNIDYAKEDKIVRKDNAVYACKKEVLRTGDGSRKDKLKHAESQLRQNDGSYLCISGRRGRLTLLRFTKNNQEMVSISQKLLQMSTTTS
ncbi:unnamed protein product [Mucor hiemalis]